MRHSSTFSLSLLMPLMVASCSPAPPAAKAPPPAAAAQPAPEPTPPGSDNEATAESEAASESTPEPAPEPEPEPSGPSTAPADMITQDDVAFMIDYGNSTPKTTAEGKCASQEGQARADCMKKARAEFLSDVLTFRKAASGAIQFAIYARRGTQLQEIYTVGAEFEEKSPTEVVLKTKGKGKGSRPLFAAERSTIVTVPDDYTLVLNDSRFGTLKYTARHGLVE